MKNFKKLLNAELVGSLGLIYRFKNGENIVVIPKKHVTFDKSGNPYIINPGYWEFCEQYLFSDSPKYVVF